MRHGKKFNHLSRKSAHRKAMLSNMACSLIEHKRIKTTLAKAKALRVYIEPLITKSKNDTTHSRRIAFSYLKQKEAITELFSDIATKVSDRQGGYTRILKLSNRLGDNAQMALIELVDYNEEYTTNKPKKSKSRRTRKKNLDQSTITESNKDNIIEDVTSSEIDRIDTKYGELRIYKILKATSTAAYIVNQDYLTTLNTLFSKSIKRMQINKTEIRKINNAYYSKGGNKIEKNVLDKAAINYHTAIDHVWGEGQFENNFIGINLQTGFCQVYESDISGYPTDNQNRQLSKTRIQI